MIAEFASHVLIIVARPSAASTSPFFVCDCIALNSSWFVVIRDEQYTPLKILHLSFFTGFHVST